MPKKTTILIAVLAVITIALLALALTSGQNLQNLTQPAPTKKTVQKTTKIYFAPAQVELAVTGPSTADVMVDTQGSDISGVQIEVQYDPKVLSNVQIIPAVDSSGFFGTSGIILLNEVIPTTGRISYAVAISAGDTTKKGVGKVATISFQKAPGSTLSESSINLLDKTLVTQLGENDSVLQKTQPLNIVIKQTTIPQGIQTTITPIRPTSAPVVQ